MHASSRAGLLFAQARTMSFKTAFLMVSLAVHPLQLASEKFGRGSNPNNPSGM